MKENVSGCFFSEHSVQETRATKTDTTKTKHNSEKAATQNTAKQLENFVYGNSIESQCTVLSCCGRRCHRTAAATTHHVSVILYFSLRKQYL